jgi:hypothetical protein
MLNSVEFHVITKKSNPFVFQLARWAHLSNNSYLYPLNDGFSIKIKNKFLRVIFKPRIYV